MSNTKKAVKTNVELSILTNDILLGLTAQVGASKAEIIQAIVTQWCDRDEESIAQDLLAIKTLTKAIRKEKDLRDYNKQSNYIP